jgi:hypothetical protein
MAGDHKNLTESDKLVEIKSAEVVEDDEELRLCTKAVLMQVSLRIYEQIST